MHVERLESRVVLATDFLSASLAAGRMELVREAPEIETFEVRGFLVESADFSIRREDAIKLAADVLKQPTEPTVLSDNEEVAKTIDETHGDCNERDSTGLTTRNELHSPHDAKSLKAECSSTPPVAIVVAPRDASDREATVDQRHETTDAATSEETGSTAPATNEATVDQRHETTDAATSEETGSAAPAAFKPAETPPRLTSGAVDGSMVWSISLPRSTTPPGRFATLESSGVPIARLQASPVGERTVGQHEQLSMTEGAVFAVSLGVPLVRYSLASDVPGALDGGAAHVSGSSTMVRVRSKCCRGKGRPTPIGMVDDLPAPSRTEPLAARSAVATELPMPKRCDEHRRPFLPQFVDGFFKESTAEPDKQTSSRDDRTDDERLDADESRQAGSVQSSTVIVGGNVAAATLAMLAYQRVSHGRDDDRADKKTWPVNSDTTRVRGDS